MMNKDNGRPKEPQENPLSASLPALVSYKVTYEAGQKPGLQNEPLLILEVQQNPDDPPQLLHLSATQDVLQDLADYLYRSVGTTKPDEILRLLHRIEKHLEIQK